MPAQAPGVTITFTSPGTAGLVIASTAAASGIVREMSGSTSTLPRRDQIDRPRLGERVDEGEMQLDFAKEQIERLDRHLEPAREHAEHDDPAAAAGERRRLGDRLGNAGAFQREVGALAPDRANLFGGRDGGARAERARERPLVRVAGQEHRLGPGDRRELQREQPDHPAADHQHPLAGLRRPDVEAVQGAGQGLGKGTMARIDAVGQDVRPPRREERELGEAAVAVDAGRDVARAEVDLAAAAGRAGAAAVVRVAGDARALGHVDAGAAGDDDAGELVAEGDRRVAGEGAVEEMPVGAADAGGLDADDEFPRARRGHRHIREAEVVRLVQPERLHASSPPRCGSHTGARRVAPAPRGKGRLRPRHADRRLPGVAVSGRHRARPHRRSPRAAGRDGPPLGPRAGRQSGASM